MAEERVKRTDKHLKKTTLNFFSEFSKWNPKGKSSAQKNLMIQDLKNAVNYVKYRHKRDTDRLKWHIKNRNATIKSLRSELKKKYSDEDVKEKLVSLRRTLSKRRLILSQKIAYKKKGINLRDDKIERLEGEIKNKTKEIAKLQRELKRKSEKISEISLRKRKVRVKEVPQPLSLEAKRLEKIAAKPVNERLVNYLDVVAKTASFVRSKDMTINYLEALLQIEVEGYVTTQDSVASTQILKLLEDRGFLSSQKVAVVKNYFLTTKGQELLKDYKNWISYSKSILNTK